MDFISPDAIIDPTIINKQQIIDFKSIEFPNKITPKTIAHAE